MKQPRDRAESVCGKEPEAGDAIAHRRWKVTSVHAQILPTKAEAFVRGSTKR